MASVLAAIGGRPTLRESDGGPYRTDQGNIVLDCRFGAIADPAALAARLSAIPGVMGHGLFLDEVDALYVAEGGVVERIERPVVAST